MTDHSLALFFQSAAFGETLRVRREAGPGRPQGLMGREVAATSFLRALLQNGRLELLEAILESERDRPSLLAACQSTLAGRSRACRVRMTPLAELPRWLRDRHGTSPHIEKTTPQVEKTTPQIEEAAQPGDEPRARVLHFPNPPEPSFAWTRRVYRPHAMAISGVTHTLCSSAAMRLIWDWTRAPVQPYDRLITTSTAVTRMVRAVTDVMAEGNQGQHPFLPIAQLPIGIDHLRHHPATPEQRRAARVKLGIPDDPRHIVLLFVGRLSHHAKAHPGPLWEAAQHVQTKCPNQTLHVVMSGWFTNDNTRSSFIRTAERLAPAVDTHFVDGLDAYWRDHVWDSADLFVSLADSIQETFGLTNLEAMSRGLPVIATDWNGYRDTIVDGKTGFRVATAMVRGSLPDVTAQLMGGCISYDQFLARVGQTVIVDTAAAARAIQTLVQDTALRRRLGQQAHQHVRRHFAWDQVIPQYESLWHEMDQQRREVEAPTTQARITTSITKESASSAADSTTAGVPELYPPIEVSFAGYPTHWLDLQTPIRFTSDATQRLRCSLDDPLCQHTPGAPKSGGRIIDFETIRQAISGSETTQGNTASWKATTLGELASRMADGSGDRAGALATAAWLMKYGVVVPAPRAGDAPTPAKPEAGVIDCTLVATCMGRLDDLQQSLPTWIAQPGVQIVVVDYSCPQQCGDWLEQHFPSVRVVRVSGKTYFDRSDAKNFGIQAVQTQWTLLVDADIGLHPDFFRSVRALSRPNRYLRSDHVGEGTGGTMLVETERLRDVGGHDPLYVGWGEEDDDLIDALRFAGLDSARFPARLLQHAAHGDDARMENHEADDRERTHLINRLYRTAKWDLARLMGEVPIIQQRRILHQRATTTVDRMLTSGRSATLEVDAGTMQSPPTCRSLRRCLTYVVSPQDKAASRQDKTPSRIDHR